VSACGEQATALVHFKELATAVPYCDRHAFNRRGEVIFGRRENGVWTSPVRHVERVRTSRGDTS
jgi:hypothetical protein